MFPGFQSKIRSKQPSGNEATIPKNFVRTNLEDNFSDRELTLIVENEYGEFRRLSVSVGCSGGSYKFYLSDSDLQELGLEVGEIYNFWLKKQ